MNSDSDSPWPLDDLDAGDFEKTRDAEAGELEVDSNESNPQTISRYRVIGQLGQGGFGRVFKAYDPELKCHVAVKIPRADRAVNPVELERFRTEAQTLARLRNHPAIVTVFDVGVTDDGLSFAVMEFVSGEPLSSWLEDRQQPIDDCLKVFLKIAGALQAAHQEGVVHRDLKPSNIIMDGPGNVTLVDFGLALHDDIAFGEFGKSVEGTPKYMAPEQIRGENHRIDGQTDIWAFGVIMYRMLTGKHPFRGRDNNELARAIRYSEARPLRQRNPAVTRELERICLKCLEKNMADRYLSVADLIEDLELATQEWLHPESQNSALRSTQSLAVDSGSKPQSASDGSRGRGSTGGSFGNTASQTDGDLLKITYKGLRPFDSNDSTFFLQLLPGPKNRDGIPESIQFWRSRVCGDELEPLDVGLIYGPSGCGKSSFIRAGLLPTLPGNIFPIYLECTREATEKRLVQQLARRIQSVSEDDSLADVLRQVRRGHHLEPEDKLFIVLDQFEQWLHGNNRIEQAELTEALRQCDGERIACLVLIRDDYWMSMSAFMKALDIAIREGSNALGLPLFDQRHARKVLIAYGRSFERLPPSTDELGSSLNAQQKRFVSDAISSLAENEKVICVHLSVFAQIVRDREWTATELNRLGGLHGVGVRFLDDLFHSTSGTRFQAEQESIVQSVFRALLPAQTSQIKGTSQTREALWRNLDGQYSRTIFDQTVDRLANEVRLISLVEDDEYFENTDANGEATEASFRLTHDFLVGPIREWLDRKQKETWRGRLTQRLSELGGAWNQTQDARFLPGLIEHAGMVSLVARRERNKYSDYMRAARGRSLGRLLLVSLLLAVGLSAGALVLNDRFNQSARHAAETYLTADKKNLGAALAKLEPWKARATVFVKDGLASADARTRVRASSYLIENADPDDRILDVFCDGIRELPALEFRDYFRTFVMLPEARKNAVREWANELDDQRKQLELACLDLEQGNSTIAESMLDRRNSRSRSFFIRDYALHAWHCDSVMRLIEGHGDSDLRSGLCLALGRKTMNSAISSEFQDVFLDSGLLQKTVNADSPAGLRAAGLYLAKRNDVEDKIEIARKSRSHEWVTLEPAPQISMTFLKIDGGAFHPRPPHVDNMVAQQFVKDRVTIKEGETTVEPFFLCEVPITREMYHHVNARWRARFSTPSNDEDLGFQIETGELPQVGLRWDEAAQFCNRLSDLYGLPAYYHGVERTPEELDSLKLYLDNSEIEWMKTRWVPRDPEGLGFRLPTSIEWQYAYRAGTETLTPYSDSFEEPFWSLFTSFHEQFAGHSTFGPVYSKMPNPIGLFDMSGNSSQWCNDVFDEFFYIHCGGKSRGEETKLISGVFSYTDFRFPVGHESIRIAISATSMNHFPETAGMDPGNASGFDAARRDSEQQTNRR